MVLRKALLLTYIGLAAGMAGVLAAGTILEKLLYEVGPRDPALLSLAVAIVLLSAGVAAALPAWRASVIDPMEALRTE
jgi:ABC-type lipoprotein release transport system permease subunit